MQRLKSETKRGIAEVTHVAISLVQQSARHSAGNQVHMNINKQSFADTVIYWHKIEFQ